MLLCLAACSTSGQLITRDELYRQGRADDEVSNILFDRDVDTLASYNVRKDGFVVIRFDPAVPEQTYVDIVQRLRASSVISGVRAEQGGVEVCPLSP
jgi:hypothetical protein